MHVFSVCVCVCNFASTSSKQAKSSQERVSHVVSHFLFPPVYLSPASRLRWNSTIKLAAGIKVKNGPQSFSVKTLNFLFLKVWKNLQIVLFFFIYFLATAFGMWDPWSSTRNGTHPCTGSTVLIHWTTQEVPRWLFFITDHYQHLPPYFPSLLLHILLIRSSLVACQ